MSLIKNGKKIAGLYKADLIKNATDTQAGIIRIATDEEVQGGTSSTTAITPYQLANQAPKTLVDNTTITKDDTDTITTIGVKSKNNVILYDWIGTEEEYNTAYDNGDIESDWICWIIDDETPIEPVSNKTTSDVALLDMIISNHILEGDEKVGKEFQGSLILKSVYPDAYNKLLNSYSTASDVTEIISNIEVTYKKCTNTWKILDITNKSVYDQLFETTGSANFFVIDIYNESFYLPKTVNFFQPVTDVNKVNSFTEAGLPNITGNFKASGKWDNVGSSGVFSQETYNIPAPTGSENNRGGVTYYFDASLSNPIYGNSDTVQPASNNVFVYYKVGTTISSEGLINVNTSENDTLPLFTSMYFDFKPNNVSWLKAGGQVNSGEIYLTCYNELVSALNSVNIYDIKVIDINNMVDGEDYSLYWKINQNDMSFTCPIRTEERILVAKKEPTDSDPTWYNLYSDGWLEQGSVNTIFTKAEMTVSFVKPYKDINYSIITEVFGLGSENYGEGISIGARSTSNFKCHGYNSSSTAQETGTWYACGYTEIPQLSEYTENVNLYFKVANAVQNLELLDTGAIMEQLNSKIHIIDTYINNDSGYIIYSNGWCKQWGTIIGNLTYSTIKVNLLKKYNDINYLIYGTRIAWSSVNNNWYTGTNNVTQQALLDITGIPSVYENKDVDGFYIPTYSNHFWITEGYLADGQY